MNHQELLHKVSAQTQMSPEQTAQCMEALSQSIRDFCNDLDAVAIPGFGTVSASKNDESIQVDPASGQRTLVPPSITVNFKSSVILRKRFVG